MTEPSLKRFLYFVAMMVAAAFLINIGVDNGAGFLVSAGVGIMVAGWEYGQRI